MGIFNGSPVAITALTLLAVFVGRFFYRLISWRLLMHNLVGTDLILPDTC